MIKLYFKIQNKILVSNLLYIIIGVILLCNVAIRIYPKTFIHVPTISDETYILIQPIKLYTYCDVYMLMIFLILIFFSLGIDFTNSMEDICLAIGGSRINKFMVRKLTTIIIIYFILYIISFINIYSIYLKLLPSNVVMSPLKEIISYSIITNVFIISLSIFILLMLKDIYVSTAIITAYYLIEESLWRCKITQKYGVLGHIYQYNDYEVGEIIKVKLIYVLLAIMLLVISYIISKRKRRVEII